jgi:hypothetical protein
MSRELLREMESQLSVDEKGSLSQVLQGSNTTQIADSEGVHSSTISKRLSGICKKYDRFIDKRQILDMQERSIRLSNPTGVSLSLKQGLINLYQKYMPERVNSIPDVIEYPEGALLIESGFYIERSQQEQKSKSDIVKSNALIRIKAPGQMGKTSMMNRVLDYAAHRGLKTVSWDLATVDRPSRLFQDLEQFLICFCQHVSRQLKISNLVADNWDGDLLSLNDACTTYFEEHILPEVSPDGLVIGLDNLDRIFAYRETSNAFLSLLRSWHDKGREDWQKVRLIISHSTEDYPRLDLNQSPFNVGIPLKLDEFACDQINDLALRHGFTTSEGMSSDQLAMLQTFKNLVGGHPYLTRLWMYHVSQHPGHWQQIAQAATTDAGIYANHLRKLWEELHQDPKLVKAMQEVITPQDPTRLNPCLRFRLDSLGLVKYVDSKLQIRCELYREYFSRNL